MSRSNGIMPGLKVDIGPHWLKPLKIFVCTELNLKLEGRISPYVSRIMSSLIGLTCLVGRTQVQGRLQHLIVSCVLANTLVSLDLRPDQEASPAS